MRGEAFGIQRQYRDTYFKIRQTWRMRAWTQAKSPVNDLIRKSVLHNVYDCPRTASRRVEKSDRASCAVPHSKKFMLVMKFDTTNASTAVLRYPRIDWSGHVRALAMR